MHKAALLIALLACGAMRATVVNTSCTSQRFAGYRTAARSARGRRI